jgi:hypothetical protein
LLGLYFLTTHSRGGLFSVPIGLTRDSRALLEAIASKVRIT